MNDVNPEAAGGRQRLTETIEAKRANPTMSSEFDLHVNHPEVFAIGDAAVATQHNQCSSRLIPEPRLEQGLASQTGRGAMSHVARR